MKLSEYAIDNHQFTIVTVILLVLFGVTAYISMPRSEDPLVQPPGANIIAIYPGASPIDIEELILDPVEESINELEDIRFLHGTARDGIGVVSVEFQSGSDPDEKYSDLVQKVNSMRQSLPENLMSLETLQWSISDVNIFQFAFISESASFRQMSIEAERLKKLLERISGIKKAQIWALPEEEVRISVDLEKCALLKIPLNYVIGAIKDADANIPGGFIDMGSKRLNIRTSGSFESLDEIRFTAIHSQGGKTVYLKDVASVDFAYEYQNYQARVNGKRAAYLTLQQKAGTNILKIAEKVNKAVSEFQSSLPESLELEVIFDQSESVSHRMSNFFNNLMQGIFLVGIIIFAAVSWRAALIVMLAIPISNLIGLGFIDASGYGLEQMSIAGLVIALGLLVDNAIVVTENIARYLRLGLSRKEAAIKGTSEVAWAVISATVTTLFAFIPIIMMQNMTGDFVRSMPLTVVYTLSASLLISLTLTPYLASKFLKVNADSAQPHLFRRWLNRFVEEKYKPALNWALHHKRFTLIAILITFIGSLALFPLIGVSFFPKADKPQFFINIEMPQGTNQDQTAAVSKKVEAVLLKTPGIKYTASNVGHGNPRIYYNMFPKRNNSAHCQFYIELESRDIKLLHSTIDNIRQKFSNFAGADIQVKELEQGPPVAAPIEIRILGENLKTLTRIAADAEQIISADKRTINVNNPASTSRIDLKVDINREKANQLGVALGEIDRTVRAAVTGMTISQFKDINGKSYNINIRLPIDKKSEFDDFDKIYIASRNGSLIQLHQLASIKLQASPMDINHFQMERSISLTADVAGKESTTSVTTAILKKLDAYPWPKGYHYYVAGQKENQEESFGGMLQAIIIAMIAIFGVLVLQFRSYLQPFIVFMAIPLAMIGSFIALFITGNSFSFTAFVGLTSLVGIVVNNAIILVDYTNQLRREGMEIVTALKRAGETRFIPIIMTTLTTVCGLLPLTLLGGTMWAPMGWTIIGGLLFSTVLTLIIVPVFYRIVTRAKRENT